jgi:hypothetical protein
MNYQSHRTSQYGGFAPATPGFTAFGPEWIFNGAASAAPAIPAAESALGSHPCVALSSAQVLPEWTTATSPCNDSSANGDNPLNFVSHSRGSLRLSSSYPSCASREADLICCPAFRATFPNSLAAFSEASSAFRAASPTFSLFRCVHAPIPNATKRINTPL